MNMLSFALTLAAALSLGLLATSPNSDVVLNNALNVNGCNTIKSPGISLNIDAVMADPAYNKVMPIENVGYEEYHRQVTNRLEYLEALLRSRDVSDWSLELQIERMKNIERLHDYRLQGDFPINYDHPDRQLPCFLDRDGNLCAVANLIAKSAGIDLVRQINNRYQYATVSEMKMPELDAWVAQSGLTPAEVITIQEPGSFSEPNFQGRFSPVSVIVAHDTTQTARQIIEADTSMLVTPSLETPTEFQQWQQTQLQQNNFSDMWQIDEPNWIDESTLKARQ